MQLFRESPPPTLSKSVISPISPSRAHSRDSTNFCVSKGPLRLVTLTTPQRSRSRRDRRMSVPDPVTIAVTGGIVLSGANQVARQAQDFLAAATGHPGESIGTILGNIMQRRIQNAESILSRSHLTLLNIGVVPNEIPLNRRESGI